MPALHRGAASLQIIGDSLDPMIVTRMLGATPSSSYACGDSATTGRVTRTARFGLWSLRTDATEPADLDIQVAELLGAVTTDLSVWSELSDRYATRLFCGWFLQGGNEGLSVAPTTLRALADRGITLDLDIYSAHT